MAFSASTSSQHSEMNVTPLIDVLLVLLIIFMVITPTTPHGLQSQLPQGEAKPVEDSSPLVVEVAGTDAALEYRVNSRAVSGEALRGTLAAAMANRQERVVFVRASRELTFQPVAAVVSAVRSAGATVIALDGPARPVV